jgi:hypothetical protein
MPPGIVFNNAFLFGCQLITDIKTISENSTNEEIIVFPNPVNKGEIISLNFPKHYNLVQLLIKDITGKDVYITSKKGSDNSFKIPGCIFNDSGMYFFILNDNVGTYKSGKIIIY